MSHEIKIHDAQTSILKELLFVPEAAFAELQKGTGLSSDHFSFHLNRLVELGLVVRAVHGAYKLTSKGKEYANRLDTDNNTVERQPKSVVVLSIERGDGSGKYVFQQRLKHPYFGFWGRPTGKIRWGETIVETAARELMEETGLTAKHEILGVYHELVHETESNELLEDKLFYMVRCTDVTGRLTESFEGGRNAWMTLGEVLGQDKVFSNFDTSQEILQGNTAFIEARISHPRADF